MSVCVCVCVCVHACVCVCVCVSVCVWGGGGGGRGGGLKVMLQRWDRTIDRTPQVQSRSEGEASPGNPTKNAGLKFSLSYQADYRREVSIL
jgi:hypothetical protein